MPFKIEKRESYRWTVEHVLSKKNGIPDEIFRIDVEFKALNSKDAEAMLQCSRADPEKFFGEVLLGWHDAPEGWEFSKAKLDELVESYPGISAAFIRAYMESIFGQTTAARKN